MVVQRQISNLELLAYLSERELAKVFIWLMLEHPALLNMGAEEVLTALSTLQNEAVEKVSDATQ